MNTNPGQTNVVPDEVRLMQWCVQWRRHDVESVDEASSDLLDYASAMLIHIMSSPWLRSINDLPRIFCLILERWRTSRSS
jgi:hypothetical protein